jgi:GTPase SAR1 family protein
MTQDTAFTILTKSKDNVLLTGKPGAGKSYLTNKYIDWVLDNTSTTIEVCASTGIAALNIKGKTLHSFLGIRNDEVTDDDIKDIIENQYAQQRIRATEERVQGLALDVERCDTC